MWYHRSPILDVQIWHTTFPKRKVIKEIIGKYEIRQFGISTNNIMQDLCSCSYHFTSKVLPSFLGKPIPHFHLFEGISLMSLFTLQLTPCSSPHPFRFQIYKPEDGPQHFISHQCQLFIPPLKTCFCSEPVDSKDWRGMRRWEPEEMKDSHSSMREWLLSKPPSPGVQNQAKVSFL